MVIVPSNNFFFFNDTATTEIYTLSLHDALPICRPQHRPEDEVHQSCGQEDAGRSEEHTSELQSQSNLVCRLLLEKNMLIGVHGLVLRAVVSKDALHALQARNELDVAQDHAQGQV